MPKKQRSKMGLKEMLKISKGGKRDKDEERKPRKKHKGPGWKRAAKSLLGIKR